MTSKSRITCTEAQMRTYAGRVFEFDEHGIANIAEPRRCVMVDYSKELWPKATQKNGEHNELER